MSAAFLLALTLLLPSCTETTASEPRAPSLALAPSGAIPEVSDAAPPVDASPGLASAPAPVDLLDPGSAPRRGLRTVSKLGSQRLRLTTTTELRRVDSDEVEDRQTETAELLVSAAEDDGRPRLSSRLVLADGAQVTLQAAIDSAQGGVDVGPTPPGLASVSRLSLWREPLPRQEVGAGARWRVVRQLSEDDAQLVQTTEYTLMPGAELRVEVERTVRPAGGAGPEQLSRGRLHFKPGAAYPSGQFETVAEVTVGGKALRLRSVVRLEESPL